VRKLKLYEVVYSFKVWANNSVSAKNKVLKVIDFNRIKDFECGDLVEVIFSGVSEDE